MSEDQRPKESRAHMNTVKVPVSMSADLDAQITATSQEVHLSKQDTIRLSIERGLIILKRQLGLPLDAPNIA